MESSAGEEDMMDQVVGVGREGTREDLGTDGIIHCDDMVYMYRTHSQGEVSTRSDRETVNLSPGGGIIVPSKHGFALMI
jgi:hypothetical protein